MNTDQWRRQVDVTGKYRFHQKNKNGEYNAPLLREPLILLDFQTLKIENSLTNTWLRLPVFERRIVFSSKLRGIQSLFILSANKYSQIVYSCDRYDYPQLQTHVFA